MNMHCVITVHQTVTVNLLEQQHCYDVLLPHLIFQHHTISMKFCFLSRHCGAAQTDMSVHCHMKESAVS